MISGRTGSRWRIEQIPVRPRSGSIEANVLSSVRKNVNRP